MPRKRAVPAPGTRPYGVRSNYTEAALKKAVEEVKTKKMSTRKATQIYKIPRSTLQHKVKGTHTKNIGKPLTFSAEEERVIEKHILALDDNDFPVTMLDVRGILKKYLDSSGRRVREFTDNMPGWEWGRNFLERHPAVKEKIQKNKIKKKTEISQSDLEVLFDDLEEELKNVPPENIYSFDEVGFLDTRCARGQLLVHRSVPHPGATAANEQTSCYTVLFCGNAASEMLPPYLVFKGKSQRTEWMSEAPPGSRVNFTKNGWIDLGTFEDWFESHFLPLLASKEGRKVLIGTSLSLHVSLRVLNLCVEHNVKFVCIAPNSTHLMQPLEVGFFAPLKRQWRDVLGRWRQADNGKTSFSNELFVQLLTKLLSECQKNVSRNLISGFKATGIFPLDRALVISKLTRSAPPVKVNVHEKVGEAFRAYLEGTRESYFANLQLGIKRNLVVAAENDGEDAEAVIPPPDDERTTQKRERKEESEQACENPTESELANEQSGTDATFANCVNYEVESSKDRQGQSSLTIVPQSSDANGYEIMQVIFQPNY